MDSNAMQIGSFEEDGGAGVSHGDAGSYPDSESLVEDWGYYEEINAAGYKGGY